MHIGAVKLADHENRTDDSRDRPFSKIDTHVSQVTLTVSNSLDAAGGETVFVPTAFGF